MVGLASFQQIKTRCFKPSLLNNVSHEAVQLDFNNQQVQKTISAISEIKPLLQPLRQLRVRVYFAVFPIKRSGFLGKRFAKL